MFGRFKCPPGFRFFTKLKWTIKKCVKDVHNLELEYLLPPLTIKAKDTWVTLTLILCIVLTTGLLVISHDKDTQVTQP